MKNQILNYSWIVVALSMLILSGCKKDDEDSGKLYTFEPGAGVQAEIQEALINMPNKSTIRLSAGTFEFTSSLSIDGKDGITIEGAGREETILSFSGQTAGAEGIKVVNCNWFLIQGLTIQDTEGDALKITDSDGVSMINMGAEWTGGPSEDNGAYGLYPVQCTNVLIDNCYVKGASDAGIYVGQSDKAIVRNSTAEMNVAGIEIENTTNADVYGNTARLNTGGILIFDLPGLSQTGKTVRVFNNEIIDNEQSNFAPAGNIVAEVPAGTGIMVMSTEEVEVFNNTLTDNNVMGIGVVSYLALTVVGDADPPDDDNYNAISAGINIHDNTFFKDGIYPADNNDIGNMLTDGFDTIPIPHILWDGLGGLDVSGDLCITNNNPQDFVNLQAPSFVPDFDLTPYDCSPAALPEVVVDAPGN